MEQLKAASSFLINKECSEEYFDKLNFLHVGCFKATLSKSLGLAIIGGSSIVKVPQIMKIIANKSGEGISIYSTLLDLFVMTASAAYNFGSGFPFSAWGDILFLIIQTMIIAALIWYYNGEKVKATTSIAVYIGVFSIIMSGFIPLSLLWLCQAINIPIIMISKSIQVYTNYANGSTGQLSATTCFMVLFGAVARIFTSIEETDDLTMIIMYICTTIANATIVAQLLYYWNVGTVKSDIKYKKMK